MGQYVLRRLFLMIPTILILTVIIFVLMRVLPGDVATMILGEEGASKASIDALREQLGLDHPLYAQYVIWLWDMARGDLGVSLISREPVSKAIIQSLPITFQISLMATLLSALLGIPLGIFSAVKQNSPLDLILRFWSIFFLAAPTFWLGILVILAGALWFNWLPPLGYHVLWKEPVDNLTQLVWPVLILASHGMATTARMTRSTMLEVLRDDYIRTARAKGLTERVVIIRHALKNALIPVVTLSALTFAALLGGTVILELIFAIPGMGQLFITSIRQQDYPTVQGIVVVFAILFMLVNLAVDLMYGWLDPRISYA